MCPSRYRTTKGLSGSGSGEFFWRKDGTCFEIEYTTTPVVDGGTHVGTVVVFRDVTEGRQLEDQLRHAQKMEAIGRLARMAELVLELSPRSWRSCSSRATRRPPTSGR